MEDIDIRVNNIDGPTEGTVIILTPYGTTFVTFAHFNKFSVEDFERFRDRKKYRLCFFEGCEVTACIQRHGNESVSLSVSNMGIVCSSYTLSEPHTDELAEKMIKLRKKMPDPPENSVLVKTSNGNGIEWKEK